MRSPSKEKGTWNAPAFRVLGVEMAWYARLSRQQRNGTRPDRANRLDSLSQSLKFFHSLSVKSERLSMGWSSGESMSASNDCLASPREASRPANVAYGPPERHRSRVSKQSRRGLGSRGWEKGGARTRSVEGFAGRDVVHFPADRKQDLAAFMVGIGPVVLLEFLRSPGAP